MPMATITALYSYPIKSCAPIVLDSSSCTPKGLPHDREYVIASSEADKIFTQRDLPNMALLRPYLDDENNVVVRGTDETEITIPAAQNGELVTLDVWGNFYSAIDQGNEISSWLSGQLGVECRLFKRTGDGEDRSTLPKDNTRYDASFVDCCPLSVVFEEEVQILNSKLSEPCSNKSFSTFNCHPGCSRQPTLLTEITAHEKSIAHIYSPNRSLCHYQHRSRRRKKCRLRMSESSSQLQNGQPKGQPRTLFLRTGSWTALSRRPDQYVAQPSPTRQKLSIYDRPLLP